MGLKKSTEEKEAQKIRNKRRRKGLFKAAKGAWKYLTDKKHYRKVKDERKTKREAERLKIKKGDKSPADKAGLSVKQRTTAAKRHETFKADRKVKDKGQKSYNKGKDKKDWVNSAYERRQKDADTAMRDAARKRHKAWKEARAKKREDKKLKRLDRKIANQKK